MAFMHGPAKKTNKKLWSKKDLIAMNNNITVTQETKDRRSVQELKIFYLDKESSLYKDMENILERKKSGQLKFHTRGDLEGT